MLFNHAHLLAARAKIQWHQEQQGDSCVTCKAQLLCGGSVPGWRAEVGELSVLSSLIGRWRRAGHSRTRECRQTGVVEGIGQQRDSSRQRQGAPQQQHDRWCGECEPQWMFCTKTEKDEAVSRLACERGCSSAGRSAGDPVPRPLAIAFINPPHDPALRLPGNADTTCFIKRKQREDRGTKQFRDGTGALGNEQSDEHGIEIPAPSTG